MLIFDNEKEKEKMMISMKRTTKTIEMTTMATTKKEKM